MSTVLSFINIPLASLGEYKIQWWMQPGSIAADIYYWRKNFVTLPRTTVMEMLPNLSFQLLMFYRIEVILKRNHISTKTGSRNICMTLNRVLYNIKIKCDWKVFALHKKRQTSHRTRQFCQCWNYWSKFK